MRTSDSSVFSDAAKSLNLWILVRETNPQSLQYIGLPGYVPKPITCKPKTAKLGPNAGLVVDPTVLKDAFEPGPSLQKATEIWNSFAATYLGRNGYSVDTREGSPRKGCLMLNGKYIHGDYDLYDIVIPDQAHRNLASVETLEGEKHSRGPRLLQVQQFINSRIGSTVVQHGGEAQYTDHSEQAIDVFAPDGSHLKLPSRAAVVSWYNAEFGGRKSLTLQPSAHVGVPGWKPRLVK